ncbi:hypothetical protein C8J56DRAFT_823626 [Mycena floridula]|nr:hypothetical protein C8J56DRAFT_823626 [Mycena floridula]
MSGLSGSASSSRHRNSSNRDEEAGHHEKPIVISSGLSTHSTHYSTPSVDSSDPAVARTWNRFRRKGKKNLPVWPSLKHIFMSSWLNAFILFVPLAWVANYYGAHLPVGNRWPWPLTLSLCFLALVPLVNLFEYLGEELSFYLGKDLGDLLVVSLNNATEATLAFILLKKCEYRLLQSTVVGNVALRLTLIPGMAFFTGGARIIEQEIHPHLAALNHVLITIGVLCLLLPAAFFATTGTVQIVDALITKQTGETVTATIATTTLEPTAVNDLRFMSHGIAFLLLFVYVCSRFYLHNPPGEDVALASHPRAPEELVHEEHHLLHGEPEINQWVAVVILAITIGLMAATGEFLVDSIESLREDRKVSEEFFGFILLPFISFSADAAVAIVLWLRRQLGQKVPPSTMAKAQAIDASVQFLLFWMPLFVLSSWWSNRKDLALVFDLFEIAILIGACFLINYVTADGKTNYAKGFALIVFYVMAAMCAWFYTRQTTVQTLLESNCEPKASAESGVAGANATVEAVVRVVSRAFVQ